MKTIVVHDKNGDIKSFGIPNPSLGGRIGLVPPPGEYTAEVDLPEIQDFASIEPQLDRIQEILQRSRVDTNGGKARLVSK
jgi:hypothetical protein